jgi:4-hydroxybenzoate polyprenyltransferase
VDIEIPLAVDLDGTLIRSDLMWESLAGLIKVRPFSVFLAPFWLLGGRAKFKRELAVRFRFDASALPYNEPFIAYLRKEKLTGRKILLVTAADRSLAEPIAAHLGIFDGVIASEAGVNLRSRAKADALVHRYGERGFDYAGNCAADVAVWRQARGVILIDVNESLAGHARAQFKVLAEFPRKSSRLKAMARAMRLHQWAKNLIVFVPLVTSHQILREKAAVPGVLAFASFCLCASGVYVINDLHDLISDRRHPTKRLRPLASGALPISWAFVLGPLLLILGFLVATATPSLFSAVLAVYVAIAFAYSLGLKRVPMVDVLVLAGLYTLRLIGGHAVTGIEFSDWLLAFSMFFFFSLALVKRFKDVQSLDSKSGGVVGGRGYVAADLGLLTPLGASSGYISVLVLALYVNSESVRVLYRHPSVLLLICPLILYWISRLWMVAHRGEMTDDPVVFALKDWSSYTVGVLALLVVWMAT